MCMHVMSHTCNNIDVWCGHRVCIGRHEKIGDVTKIILDMLIRCLIHVCDVVCMHGECMVTYSCGERGVSDGCGDGWMDGVN